MLKKNDNGILVEVKEISKTKHTVSVEDKVFEFSKHSEVQHFLSKLKNQHELNITYKAK